MKASHHAIFSIIQPPYMAAIYLGIVVLMALGLIGCESSESATTTTNNSVDTNAESDQHANDRDNALTIDDKHSQPTLTTPIAQGGPITITLGDFIQNARRSLLFAPANADGTYPTEVPPEQLAAPHLHATVVNSLVRRAIIMHEANNLGLITTAEERIQFLDDHPALAEYSALLLDDNSGQNQVEKLKHLGLTPDDIFDIANEEIIVQKFKDHLFHSQDDDVFWQAYQDQHNTANIAVLKTLNTPTSAEVTRFVTQDKTQPSPRIDKYYQDNPARFMTPATVNLTLLRISNAQDQDAIEAILKQATQRLSSGESPQSVASGLGLTVEDDATLIAQENPRAYRASVGETGYELQGTRGAYAWIVRAIHSPQPSPLNRSLRREIAAELLRQDGVIKSVEQTLHPLTQQLCDTVASKNDPEHDIEYLKEKFSAQSEVTFHITGHFPVASRGYIPEIGLAEEVLQKVNESISKYDDNPSYRCSKSPIQSREHAYSFAILDRNTPSRADYEREKESFQSKFFQDNEDIFLQRFIMEKMQGFNIVADARPLRAKFGVLNKDERKQGTDTVNE